MSVQFVLTLCHHSNRSWPPMVHHSRSLSPHPPLQPPASVRTEPRSWLRPAARAPPTPTRFQAKQQRPPDRGSVFFFIRIQALHFLLLHGPTTAKKILSLPGLLTSPQCTPPLPMLLILSELRNQPKSESIFVPCVTKYLCIIKDFSCVCAINY